MKYFVILTFLFCLNASATKDAKVSKLSLLGTYIDMVLENKEIVEKNKFESLPSVWGKNGNYYQAVLLLDSSGYLKSKDWIGEIEIIKDSKTVESIKIPKKNMKAIGDKYFMTSFKRLVPSQHETPYMIKYLIKVKGEEVFGHVMKIKSED